MSEDNLMQQGLTKMGWSHRFFGEYCGVSTKTVDRWCNREPDPTAMRLLNMVCLVVDV